jgi:ubiquinone/menaquinone biosynthesis C-methylase UbiE
MNVSDKRGVFREAHRVLRPGGSLALSLAGVGSAGEPCYPLPWAITPDISFLVTPDELRGDLLAAGFRIALLHDTAGAMAPVLKQLETEGIPPLGEHIVTGENTKEWRVNAIRGQAEGRLSLIEALARKPT